MTNTVLVANLPPSVDASTLEDMFSLVGNVVKAQVIYDVATGVSQGQGYVQMASLEEVQNCVIYFNGQIKNGNTLIVREDKPKVARPPVSANSLKSRRGSK